MNDKIYVLSSSASGNESMFLKGPGWKNLNASILDEITTNLYKAKTFRTEKEAWEWRETCACTGWQITPIDAKKMFKGKLSK